jgi:hypothetical protein
VQPVRAVGERIFGGVRELATASKNLGGAGGLPLGRRDYRNDDGDISRYHISRNGELVTYRGCCCCVVANYGSCPV